MGMKLALYLLVTCTLLTVSAQAADAEEPPSIQQLDAQLEKGELTDNEYLKAVANWVQRQFAAGNHFHRDSLIKHLATFQQIAWGTDSLVAPRINYYIDLSNNANYANRDGESIYFLEKAEQEISAAYGEKPLLVAGRKCNSYYDNGSYRNVITTYQQVRDYIQQFPELLRSKAINLNIAASFINVLKPTVQAYAKLQDTTGVNEALRLAEQIYEELAKQINPARPNAVTIRFYMRELYYHKYFTLEHDQRKSREALQAMQTALYADSSASATLIGQLAPVLETKLVDYFLTYHQNDSAAYYLARLKEIPDVFSDHNFTLNLYEARLLGNQGKYQLAFERTEAAVHSIDSIRSVLVDDIDELLYAHTEAEFNRQALQIAEKQKNTRTIWLIAIIVCATLATVITYVSIRRRNKKTQDQLDRLNQTVNMQVAAMEEIKAQAIREEQKRLARDLHDGLSSTLASAKLQLEVLTMDSSPELADRVTRIQDQIEYAYTIAREKSHEWYESSNSSAEADFETRIQNILNSVLVDNQYTKEVHVDRGALTELSLDVRINLLRIVQEAITNTIKHAKARHVAVLLYREDAHLILSITDDGKGSALKSATGSGIGIRSMRDRTEQYGGQLVFESGPQGTHITASIPLLQAKTTAS